MMVFSVLELTFFLVFAEHNKAGSEVMEQETERIE